MKFLQLALLLVISSKSNLVGSFAPNKLNRSSQSSQSCRTSSLNVKQGESEADSQNMFGVFSDAATGAAFSLLHAFDDCGIQDSSKNLRVLWVRALLAQRGLIKDDVASTLLPKTTRSLVTTDAGANLFDPIVQFTEWIQARTDFIDEALDAFLSSPVCQDSSGKPLQCNVVLFGAGYDTRALRYRHAHDHKMNIIEVDLDSVIEGKDKLYEKFKKENDPEWNRERNGSKLVAFDLNSCGGSNPKSLVGALREQGGLAENVPTLFVWEAVLFYVNEDAIQNIFKELFSFSQKGGNGDDPRAESMICFTDSLKPFVDVPFTSETSSFFSRNNLDLVQHRSRWGGAVHFALVSSKGESLTASEKIQSKEKSRQITGQIGKFVAERVGGLVSSYTPTQGNNPELLENPSFDNTWYAVGYPWQIDGHENAIHAAFNWKPKNAGKPFSTRLWGEPIIIYRDEDGNPTAMVDVCPHRSAPLSMGTVENGKVVCFYHGWAFGKDSACADIPTLNAVAEDRLDLEKNERFKERITKANCQNHRAVVEHEGLIWVWKGEILAADPAKLPSRRKGDMESLPISTILDYDVDYSYIVENNLDSPHLFYLHDGSVPPIESIGMMSKNLNKLRLSSFQDDCGFGHLGKLGDTGRVKKLLRFDPPNIVRHGGVSGFEEEFHIVPIAPYRTRVLLRQHLPKGPILSTITSIPYMVPFLTALVNNWNYHIALEDAGVMKGQSHNIEDFGAPRMKSGALGDDLIAKYWSWRSKAHTNLTQNKQNSSASPYFSTFQNEKRAGIPSGTAYGDDPQIVSQVRSDSQLRNVPLVTSDVTKDENTGNEIGTWGIKQNYVQNSPAADFPPMNYKAYKNALFFDDLIKKLFVAEPSGSMIKTAMSDLSDDMYKKSYPEPKIKVERRSRRKNERKNDLVRAASAAAAVMTGVFVVDSNMAVANALSSVMTSKIFFMWQ